MLIRKVDHSSTTSRKSSVKNITKLQKGIQSGVEINTKYKIFILIPLCVGLEFNKSLTRLVMLGEDSRPSSIGAIL